MWVDLCCFFLESNSLLLPLQSITGSPALDAGCVYGKCYQMCEQGVLVGRASNNKVMSSVPVHIPQSSPTCGHSIEPHKLALCSFCHGGDGLQRL